MLTTYFIAAAIFGYLLGSIPFGLLLTRWAGLGDIRNVGSGNIGATNVMRTGRKDIALATLVLDAAKAGIALLIARALSESTGQHIAIGLVAGAAAFIGHCYPVWLKFKGGKGVATFFGVLFAGIWPIGFVAGLTWIAVFLMFGYSSLAALCAAAIAPILAMVAGFDWWEIGFTLVIGALIFWRHRANIERLRNGVEPKTKLFGKKEDAPAASQPPPSPPASA